MDGKEFVIPLVVILQSPQSRLCFLRARYLFVLFFIYGIRAMAPSRKVCLASRDGLQLWNVMHDWLLGENANWKSIFLKPRGTNDDGFAGWTVSRTFETEEELRVLSRVNSINREECLASVLASSRLVIPVKNWKTLEDK